jgi:hypothetical protein
MSTPVAVVGAVLLTLLAALVNRRRLYAQPLSNFRSTKMKTIRTSILCGVLLLLTAPMLRAQDFSKYRNFSLGTNLASVLKQTDERLADVRATHDGSLLFQELTWQPANSMGVAYRSESVDELVFSFYKGELYKMVVSYDRASTEGLTADDMVKSIVVKYGPATTVALEIDSAGNEQYELRQKPVASWEDSLYSFNLMRSQFSNAFQLVIYSKRVTVEADAALAEVVRVDELEAPQRAVARQKKVADENELARQKNQKSFRP